jgi:hypothetical protein
MKNFDIVVAIAAALNGTWEPRKNYHDSHEHDFDTQHRILAPNGSGMCLGCPDEDDVKRGKNRVTISGIWPRRNPGEQVTPSSLCTDEQAPVITISLSKTPEEIARDIERRFLPLYLPLWEKCSVKGQELNAAEAKELSVKEEYGAALGIELSNDSKRPGNHINLNVKLAGGAYFWSSAYVSSDGSLSFDVRNVPKETALKIIKLLRDGK